MAIRFRRHAAPVGVLLFSPPAAKRTAQVPAARIDSIFAFARDTTPGSALSAMRDGAVLYSKGYGIADFEHSAPITPETVFYMATAGRHPGSRYPDSLRSQQCRHQHQEHQEPGHDGSGITNSSTITMLALAVERCRIRFAS
jgi:hypothetical protein